MRKWSDHVSDDTPIVTAEDALEFIAGFKSLLVNLDDADLEIVISAIDAIHEGIRLRLPR